MKRPMGLGLSVDLGSLTVVLLSLPSKPVKCWSGDAGCKGSTSVWGAHSPLPCFPLAAFCDSRIWTKWVFNEGDLSLFQVKEREAQRQAVAAPGRCLADLQVQGASLTKALRYCTWKPIMAMFAGGQTPSQPPTGMLTGAANVPGRLVPGRHKRAQQPCRTFQRLQCGIPGGVLQAFPSSFSIFSHTVVSPNKIMCI